MEKRKPHYNLELIKSLINKGDYSITKIAVKNAAFDFGFNAEDIIRQILELEVRHFYKSMTSDFDNSIWQDVYHKRITITETAYIKLQLKNDNSVIIQFKRK